jgi:hypothetical protein
MGEPTYWPTNINKTPDVLHFFIFERLSHHSLGIKPNFRDSIRSHTNNCDHQCTYYNSPELHNSQTNWEAFRTQIEENLQFTAEWSYSSLRMMNHVDPELRYALSKHVSVCLSTKFGVQIPFKTQALLATVDITQDI